MVYNSSERTCKLMIAPGEELQEINFASSFCRTQSVIKHYFLQWPFRACGRHSGLKVSVLVSRLSGPGSSPGQGHCAVFLGKTLNTLTVPLSTQGIGKFNAGW